MKTDEKPYANAQQGGQDVGCTSIIVFVKTTH